MAVIAGRLLLISHFSNVLQFSHFFCLCRNMCVCVCVCVSFNTRVCLSICLFVHPVLAPIAATNMSSMLHDSVQALAGDGLGHGVPLGQTGL